MCATQAFEHSVCSAGAAMRSAICTASLDHFGASSPSAQGVESKRGVSVKDSKLSCFGSSDVIEWMHSRAVDSLFL